MKTGSNLLTEYRKHLDRERGLAQATCDGYLSDIFEFARFVKSHRSSVINASPADVGRYLEDQLRRCCKRTAARRLYSLKGFYRWLQLERILRTDPTEHYGVRLTLSIRPKALTEVEVAAMLEPVHCSPDNWRKRALGLRDQAIVEVLYACGLRSGEIVKSNISDPELDERQLRVHGKGNKERIVSLTRTAAEALRTYLRDGRPCLVEMARAASKGEKSRKRIKAPAGKGKSSKQEGTPLFISERGRRISRQRIFQVVRARSAAASPHRLRHSCATHLIDHGTDLEIVQILLGHAYMSTTRVYTHSTLAQLKVAHRKYHPRGTHRCDGRDGYSATSGGAESPAETDNANSEPEVSK